MPEMKGFTGGPAELKVHDIITRIDLNDVVSGRRAAKVLNPVVTSHPKTMAKNVAINTDQGLITLRREAELVYERMTPTAEEEEANRQAEIARYVERFITKIDAWADQDPAAYLAEKLAGYAWDVASGLSWEAENTMYMSAQVRVGAQVRQMREAVAVDSTPKFSNDDVYREIIKEARQEIVRAVRSPARSTSVMHNVAEQMKAKVHADILEDFDHGTVQYLERLGAER